MNVGAILSSFIYLIANALLYPAQLLLSGLTLWLVYQLGVFLGEWLERLKLTRLPQAELIRAIRGGEITGVLPRRVQQAYEKIRELMKGPQELRGVNLEYLLQESNTRLWKALDAVRILIRVGPGLGLMGTLIPMGTGLAALGQGDMTKLSADLVVAFTTTVVGLALGTTSYFLFTIKRRWAEEDIRNLEFISEILAS